MGWKLTSFGYLHFCSSIKVNNIWYSSMDPRTVARYFLQEPSEVINLWTILQLRGRYVLGGQLDALAAVSSLVVESHVCTECSCDQESACTKAGGCNQSREVLGRVLVLEQVAGHESHEVGQRHSHRSQNKSLSFVRDVVVVPLKLELAFVPCNP